mmetsp:Transcript_13726/g.24793  ORF Transcript_13726/g.24793 Transcript_13726/m.24793 type:complete len:278 (+) Transcript_13726:148-981(+)
MWVYWKIDGLGSAGGGQELRVRLLLLQRIQLCVLNRGEVQVDTHAVVGLGLGGASVPELRHDQRDVVLAPVLVSVRDERDNVGAGVHCRLGFEHKLGDLFGTNEVPHTVRGNHKVAVVGADLGLGEVRLAAQAPLRKGEVSQRPGDCQHVHQPAVADPAPGLFDPQLFVRVVRLVSGYAADFHRLSGTDENSPRVAYRGAVQRQHPALLLLGYEAGLDGRALVVPHLGTQALHQVRHATARVFERERWPPVHLARLEKLDWNALLAAEIKAAAALLC